MEIVSWHPFLTDHLSYTLEALQRTANHDLTVYVGTAEHPTRQAQGWVNRHASSLSPQTLPRRRWLRDLIQRIRAHRHAVHLFGSPFDQPRLIVALMLAVAIRTKVFLICEPYSPVSSGYLDDKRRLLNWLKARLRPLVYRCYGIMLRRRVAGVFAISPLAASQYRALGIPSEKIFPFGYFVPREKVPLPASHLAFDPGNLGFRLIFVGTMITVKGLDVLIDAVKSLYRDGVDISLDAYGSGDPGRFEFDHASVRYRGAIRFGTAQSVIARYDALVLPSRYDGWGVVVNEALMAGVPVVCSDRVGAGVVVNAWGCGAVFASEDVADLKAKLSDLALHRDHLARVTAAARDAGLALDPALAGRFMFDVIRGAAVGATRNPEFLSPNNRAGAKSPGSDVMSVRLHLTNIAGLGAIQLLKSLLPALERVPGYRVEKMYLPDWGELAGHATVHNGTSSRYRRRAPNALSRFLECTLFARRFDGETPLLVMGDVPLRCRSRQTVFVQNSLLTQDSLSARSRGPLKYRVSRWLFRYNADRVSTFIVQTEAMKASLVATYPEIEGRVHVVSLPVPVWLIDRPLRRTGRRDSASGLRLFYPASFYPHKNHSLLSEILKRDATNWPIAELSLTVPANQNPNASLPWIRCLGRIDSNEVIALYERVDALLYLSHAESLGFPLVEAMWIGLPIICPDLPYARVLCGDGAIYFDPNSVSSLHEAVAELRRRLDAGWWPDWTERLPAIPGNWEAVASAMLELATEG